MKHLNQKRLNRVILGLIVAMGIAGSGCSALTKKGQATAPASEVKTSTGAAASYYDFSDVLVPQELKVDKKSSSIYQTGGFVTGVLVLKGRIEASSLISFFKNNMAKDNWRIISTFKSERTMMLFQKENRWCVIYITDQTFNTYVEIWVAPTTMENQVGFIK